MIRAVPLALLLLAGRGAALEAPADFRWMPSLVLADGVPQEEAAAPQLKSPWTALGLSALVELPTLLVGPSLGHLYAGEDRHFWITGSIRLGALAMLLILEVWGPGVGPLYAVTQPENAAASISAYPVAFTVDVLLVLVIVVSAIYDLIDAPYAALRANAQATAVAPLPQARAAPSASWTVASF